MKHRSLALAFAALLLPTLACSEEPPVGGDPPSTGTEEGEVLVGEVTRQELEAHQPDWVAALVEAQADPTTAPDAEAAMALAAVEPGAEVTVYLGTWCSDSKRELARLWGAFDSAGIEPGSGAPFDLRYVAVDRDKRQPAALLAGADLQYVPTFVVRRGGEEVGRIVEVAPTGIEHDLLALLTGETSGVVSGRDDLGGAGSH
ncbi:MAG TPA: hypothetical protein VHQ65_16845 [Thermoanaerobaculia bacterium]|nr:hypothetical protein [Thermoanaerobaculia bacterium]